MPVEKLRLRPWLEKEIDSGKTVGLSWVDRNKRIFRVPWKHASRQGWNIDRDASVFRSWAIHSGRYREHIDKPDPRRWKANFRCALNALPDIREIPKQGISRGNHAYKVYQMVVKADKKESAKQPSNKCTTGSRNRAAPEPKEEVKQPKESVNTKFPVKESPSLSTAVFYADYTTQYAGIFAETNPFFGFIPKACLTSFPHLKDHDYFTSPRWADTRPEMKDIGIMAHPLIKQEPLSPEERRVCDEFPHGDEMCDLHTVTIEEDQVPSDQEIVDLVDEMSSGTSSPSPFDDGFNDSGSDDGTDAGALCSPSPSTRPRLHLDVKNERSQDYGMPNLGPLTPESTLAILKGINTVPQHEQMGSE